MAFAVSTLFPPDCLPATLTSKTLIRPTDIANAQSGATHLGWSASFSGAKMKTSSMRKVRMLANIFNLLVAIYFIVISIISLVQLRWYHRLTITTRVRHVVTSATSYFAFIILLVAAIILIIIFVASTISLSPRTYVSGQDAIGDRTHSTTSKERPILSESTAGRGGGGGSGGGGETSASRRSGEETTIGLAQNSFVESRLILKDSSARHSSQSSLWCSIFLHLISSISSVVILVVWLLNTGELVRDSISTQLELAFARYQFANRSNHYSIAVDGMQDINNCCGSLDYTDFPHQRISQLSSGHYPGSCCGKNIFGVNARVLCTPEEIVRARQTVS